MKVRLFPAPKIKIQKEIHPLFESSLYASKGRWAIYHILRQFGDIRSLALPSFLCETVIDALKALKIKPIYFDIDSKDLNPSLSSFIEIALPQKPDVVLVPSLYGNPADLLGFEKICKEHEILLIDDSAQSYGASLNERSLGHDFGDAGLIAFSPGKATAAHMGALYHMRKGCSIDTTNTKCKPWIHELYWKDFQYNRTLENRSNMGKVSSKLKNLVKERDFIEEGISKRDIERLSSVLFSFEKVKVWRKKLFDQLKKSFLSVEDVRIIESLRGESVTHKWVFLVEDLEKAIKFKNFLFNANISWFNGYASLAEEALLNVDAVQGRIIELPLLYDLESMEYLCRVIDEFWNTKSLMMLKNVSLHSYQEC